VSGRARWLIAGGGIVVAVAAIALAVAALSARPTPAALTYVPRDSDVVVELRPDLPGDQQQRVGNLLAHFPGFQDQSTLARKLDETLARITASASNGTVDYASQVKPWLAGPVIGSGDVRSRMTAAQPSVAVVFTTDGTVTCDPFTDGSATTEPYRGLEIHTSTAGRDDACVLDGRHAIVGTLDGVRAALDAHADHASIDGEAAYRAAQATLTGDQLATVFVSYRHLASAISQGLPSADASMAAGFAALSGALPEWSILGLRAEDDALVVDEVVAPFGADAAALNGLASAVGASPVPPPSLLTAPPPHVSALAGIVPGDTAVLYELHGAGVTLHNLVASLTAIAGLAGTDAGLGQIDTVLEALGGIDGLTGWVGDAGLVVLTDGTTVDGGLVLLAPDAATATAKATQLLGWLTLAGGRLATSSEGTVDDTTVTLVDFGDAAGLLGRLGASVGSATLPPGTRVVLSVAAHGSAVIVGSGERFARRIIDTASGSSLANAASYRTATGRVGTSSTGQLYVAIQPLLALAEATIPQAQRAYYESDVKPYLEPLDAFVETTTADGSGFRVRLAVTLRQVQ
jgi:hypothetical protein